MSCFCCFKVNQFMLKSMCIYEVFYPCAYLKRHNFRCDEIL